MKKTLLSLSSIGLLILLAGAMGFVHAGTGNDAGFDLKVDTQYGMVRGMLKNGMREFLGIPYARPPLGRLRWSPPVPAIKWKNTKLATTYGGGCAQGKNGLFSEATTNENCLFINVFAPKKSTAKNSLAVMVWIYGGGLNHGSSSAYDPQLLVKDGNVIVVTFNYRTNIFGFLAIPGLEYKGEKFADFGIMDQQYALAWVKKNISNFGGDPNKVTIFGESAGGLSVLANIISPTAKNLFRSAIVESGSYTSLDTPVKFSVAEKRGKQFVKSVGCNKSTQLETIECLRGLSVEEIQSKGSRFANSGTSLILDGAVLTNTQAQAFSTGDFNEVPVILGSNKDEVTNFIGHSEYESGSTITLEQFKANVESKFGRNANTILSTYTMQNYKRPDSALAAVGTDSIFVCPGLKEADLLRKFVPTYYYEFADETAPVYLHMAPIPYGSYHSSELQYLFLKFHGTQGHVHILNKSQATLSANMVSYWTNFSKYGDPNAASLPEWTSLERGSYMSLQRRHPESKDVDFLIKEHHCNLWGTISG